MLRLLVAALVAISLLPDRALADDPRPQWRAFWVDAFNPGFKTPEQAVQLIADLKAINGNTLIVQVRKRGDALFRRSVEPFTEDNSIPNGFDPLAHLLELAHKEGIQVHAWINVSTIWPGNLPPPKAPDHVFNRHGPGQPGRLDWLARDEAGRTRFASGHFADPGHPDYAEHFVNVVRDLVKQYPVDGIHFDYVRYSETDGDSLRGYGAGYNPTNVARFNRVHQRTGLPDRGDPLWQHWRRQQVSQLVSRVRIALLETKPSVLLSGALIPWGAGPSDETAWLRSAPYNRVFQNWHAWRKQGLLDFIVPMNYDREALPAQKAFFDQWIRFEKQHRERTLSVVGIGAYMNLEVDTVAQVNRALAPEHELNGADGVSFFSYAALNRIDNGRRKIDVFRDLLVTAPDAPFDEPAPLPVVPRLRGLNEGIIAGRATGADGQPLDTIAILIEPVAGGPPLSCVTDSNGHFAAFAVPPGKYRLAIPTRGPALLKVVEVIAGQITRVGDT